MNIYTILFHISGAQLAGDGRRSPLPYLKNRKKTTLILEKALLACMYKLNFHLKYGFQSILEKK